MGALRLRWIALAAIGLSVLAAGCGDENKTLPSGTPKATVLALLDAVQAGQFDRACELLSDDAIQGVRLAAIGSNLVVPAGSTAQRRRFIKDAHRDAASCPGALNLRAAQLGSARLARVRSAAAGQVPTTPFPSETTVLGDQEWVIEPRGARWEITTATPFL